MKTEGMKLKSLMIIGITDGIINAISQSCKDNNIDMFSFIIDMMKDDNMMKEISVICSKIGINREIFVDKLKKEIEAHIKPKFKIRKIRHGAKNFKRISNNCEVVYFVKSGDFIKIGTTTCFESRFDALQSYNPVKLEVLMVVSGGKDLERAFHRHFHEMRVRNEWFSADPKLLEFIDNFKSSSFSIMEQDDVIVEKPKSGISIDEAIGIISINELKSLPPFLQDFLS